MKKEIDARGLDCPEPVILAKKTIEEEGDCSIIVDNEAARDNVCRMAESQGCDVRVEEREDTYHIRITRRGEKREKTESVSPSRGSTVVVFSCDRMGRGDDELGSVLIKGFFHALGEVSPKPDILIFFNAGVKLTAQGSEVLEDLHSLEEQGATILVCGTCLDYYGLKEKIRTGIVSNMYDIAETMLSAGKVIRI
jgi:selenium metabolism protein YedF